ncbi:MAG TPA: hypothetical protein VLM37_12140 [Fibrobacteraceae bacterium]|nr:hypothetical protein [Fibrobacteraceae bacterium]
MRKITVSGCALLFCAMVWGGQTSKEVEVPVDISIGPAFHYLPSSLSDGQTLLPGVAIDVFGVISPEVLRQNRDRVPKRWRSMMSMDQEMHIKPWWLTLFPTTFIIHPGKEHEVWGASWSLVGINWNNRPTKTTEVQAHIKLPTVTWIWVKSPRIEEGDENLIGIGATPGVQVLWRPWPSLQFTLGWDQNFYLPLACTEYTPLDHTSKDWMWQGVASFMVHVRIPSKQRI